MKNTFKLVILALFCALLSIARANAAYVDDRNAVIASGKGLTVGSPTAPAGGMQPGYINATTILVNGTPIAGGLTVPNSCIIGGNGAALTTPAFSGLSCVGDTLTVTGGALPSIANGYLLANASGVTGTPSGLSLSSYLDYVFGAVQGSVLTRNASGWVALTPGVSGYFLQTMGSNQNAQWAAAGGGGGGNVSGPGSSTVGHVATFNNTSGTLLADGGALGALASASSVNLASQVTGTLALTNGGTGQTTAQAAMNALAAAVTSGLYLRGNGTNVVLAAIQVGDVPTLNQNTTGSAASLSASLPISGLASIAANTVLGALTATTPSALAVPSCSATNNALQYTSAVGFSCVTISGGGGSPGGSPNQIQWNSAGSFAGFTASGDATIVPSTGVVTVGSIGGHAVTLGGTLTTSGAYNLTLTLTGATGVTLPTSGTLLTTTGNGSSLTGLTVSQVSGAAPLASPTFTGTVGLPAGQVVNGVTLSTSAGATNFVNGAGAYAAPFALTTTGSSGAATFSGGTLNIPQYSGGSSNLNPISNTVTTNGTLVAADTLTVITGGTAFTLGAAADTHTKIINNQSGATVTITFSLNGLSTGYPLANGSFFRISYQSTLSTYINI